jgi:polyphosphate glucokinase
MDARERLLGGAGDRAERPVRVLVVDVGGTNIKIAASDRPAIHKLPSGPSLAPAAMVTAVKAATRGWRYDVVAVGYPGPVVDGRPAQEPNHLGAGWVRFDFARAFDRPVRIVNDAVMQALGCYQGGRLLFLGLGTGLGTALVLDGQAHPLEVGQLPYRRGRTFEDYLGKRGLDRLGRRRWQRHVEQVVPLLRFALQADDVAVGGGNAKKLSRAPEGARITRNSDAIRGGVRLWTDASGARRGPGRAGAQREWA